MMNEPEMMHGETERTAYHEAGHAVLACFLGIGLQRVTIVPDDDSFGAMIDGGEFGGDSERLRDAAPEAFWIRMAIVLYAGAEAVRRRAPRSRWKQGAANDYRWAGIALEKITDDADSLRSLQSYAMRRARLLVAHYWPEVELLACQLVMHTAMEGDAVRRAIVKSVQDRRAGLMSY